MFLVLTVAGQFMTDLSKAVFLLHEPDKLARTSYMLKQINPATGNKWTQVEINNLPDSYWNDYCRRLIPPPGVLSERVQACFDKHQNDVDPAGNLLFTNDTHQCHKRQMELIQKGYLSG